MCAVEGEGSATVAGVAEAPAVVDVVSHAVTIVVNAMSGTVLRSSQDEQHEAIRRGARRAGRKVDVVFVPPQQVESALRAALASQPRLLVCGGGDGTVSTAARLLRDSGTALGPLPLGTCNFLARQLGFSTDVEEATFQILTGRLTRMDLAEVNGCPFVNAATIGLYIEVVKAREKRRKSTGESRWFASAGDFLRVVFRMPTLRLRISGSKTSGWVKTPLVFVGNNEYGESLAEFGLRRRIDGGELVLMRGRRMTLPHFANVVWNFLVRRVRQSRWVERYVAREIRIDSPLEKIELSIDGDRRVLTPPLLFRSLPLALEVVAAEGSAAAERRDREPSE